MLSRRASYHRMGQSCAKTTPSALGRHTRTAGLSVADSYCTFPDSELVALKQENANLRTTNELLRRSHETVLRENRQLQAKLERLEGVFVGGDAGSPSR